VINKPNTTKWVPLRGYSWIGIVNSFRWRKG